MNARLAEAWRRVEQDAQVVCVIRQGHYTFVEMTAKIGDGEKRSFYGFAKCSPKDTYNAQVGEAIATGRARKQVAEAEDRYCWMHGIDFEIYAARKTLDATLRDLEQLAKADCAKEAVP